VPRARPSLAALLAAVATVVALASAWHSGARIWRSLGSSHRIYAGYSDEERRRAPLQAMGLPGDVFDFYASFLVHGDRVYYQVKESGLGQFLDLPTAVRYAGNFYFLPAVHAHDLDDATVVVTHYGDPKLLHRRFVPQKEAGLQPFYVSRISAP